MATSMPASTSNLAKRLVLTLPDDGSKVSITTSPDDTVVLDFDLAVAVFDRTDDNLEIKMDNGAVILLSGFFSGGEEQIPNFEVRGGALIAGSDFLQAVSPEIDLSPAEGEEQQQQQQQQPVLANKGSGVGEYRDETVALVSKVESIPVYQEIGNSFLWNNSISDSAPVIASSENKLPEPSPVVRDLNVEEPFRGAVVAEAGLPEGTTPGQGASSAWQAFSLPKEAYPVGLEAGGSLTVYGEHGEFTIRHIEGDAYEYSYTLTSGIVNPQDGNGTISDADAISLQISDGFNTGTIQLIADVVDDVPELSLAEGEGPSWAGASLYSGYDIQGVYSVSFGADGEKEDSAIQLKISDGSGSVTTLDITFDSAMDVAVGGTHYGTIEFKSDGTYLFKPVSNLTASLTLSIGATDGDGDFAESANVVLDITPPVVDLQPLGSHADEWFSEQNLLPGGTAADSSQLTKNILLPDGFKVDLDADGWVAQGWQESWGGREVKGYVYTKVNADSTADNGTLTCIVTENGQRLTYTLESSIAHSQQGVEHSDIAYGSVGSITLKDSGGNTYSVDTKFVIYDDQPDVRMFGSGTAQSGMPYSGTWSAVYGADGPAAEGALSISVNVFDRQSGQTLQVSGTLTQGIPFVMDDGNGNSLGTLTLLEGGRFEFVPAPNLEADFSFTLTAKDADGDRVSTDGSFTIKVSKEAPTDLPDYLGDVVFDEAHIVAGGKNPSEGTSPDADALTMPIEIPGNYTVDTAGWTQIDSGIWTREGEFGFLTYDTTGEPAVLTYTLESAPQASGDGKNITYDSLQINLQDSGGNTFEVPVKIGIADDVPQVSAEGMDGVAAVVESGETFADGVWNVHFGADGPAEEDSLILKVTLVGGSEVCLRQVVPGNGPVEIAFEGTVYGSLTLNSDGTYSFKANPNVSGQLLFSLIASDADGDAVNSGSFSLTIALPGGPDIPYLGHDVTLYESSFENGTAPNDDLLTQQLAIPSGFRIDVTAEGWILQEDGSYLQKGAKGYFVCSADGASLKYTLTGRVENNGNDSIEHDSNKGYDVLTGIRLLNDGGNEYYINAQIAIADDAPILHLGNGKTYEVESGREFTSDAGEYLLKFGADGSAPQGEQPLVLSVSLNGKPAELVSISRGGTIDISVKGVQYGTLTLNDDGTFSFKAAPDTGDKAPVHLQFGLTAKDSDGDVSSTCDDPVTIIISKPSLLESYVLGEGLEVSEAHLPEGTAANEAGLTKVLELPDGFTPVLTGWTAGEDGVFTLSGPDNYGTLTWDGKTLSYTLEKAAGHGTSGSNDDTLLQDVFSGVKLRDSYGNTYEVKAEIGIVDDVPELQFGKGDSYEVESGREFVSEQGGFLLSFGADGASGESPLMLSVSINGIPADVMTLSPGEPFDIIIGGVVYGALTLHDNGTFSFKAEPNLTSDEPVQLELGLIAVDSEGDKASSLDKPVTIVITKPSGLPEGFILGAGTEVSEAYLPGGSAEGEGSLSKTLELPEGFTPCLEGWTESGNGVFTFTGADNCGSLSWDGSKLTYTLEKAAAHGASGSDADNVLQDVFSGIRIEDAYGNIYEVQTEIGVADDSPEVYFGNGESYTVESGAEVVSEEGYRISYGADGAAIDAEQALSLILSLDGETAGTFAVTLGKGVDISVGETFYGSLILNLDGTFTFKAASDLVLDEPIQLGFALAAMDADGDVSGSGDAPVTITITKPSGLPEGFVLGEGIEIDEAHLPGGTAAGEGALGKELPLPEGYTPETSGWAQSEDGSYTLAGKYGTLCWDGNKLVYTLQEAVTHGAPGTETDLSLGDVFTEVTLLDSKGNSHKVKAEVSIIDDTPQLTVTEGGDAGLGNDANSDFRTQGVINLNFGADGDGGDEVFAVNLEFLYTGKGDPEEGTLALQVPKDGSSVSFETALGKGSVYYDAQSSALRYEYEALRGQQNDTEQLTFSISDADQDRAEASVMLTLHDDVLGLTMEVDEAGLSFGSASAGHGAAENSGVLAEAMVAPGTVQILWDLESIPEIRADGNQDGSYDNVVWTQVGDSLYGYADNELAIKVDPEFEDGVFTGALSVDMYKAFAHGVAEEFGDTLELKLGFEQINAQGKAAHATIAVHIKDDMPFGNTPEGNGKEPDNITAMEGGQVREDVFLVVDVSGSIDADAMKQQIDAIRFLAETYEANGIDAIFTLIPFGSSAELRLEGVDTETLLAQLSADEEGIDYLRGTILGGTNYTAGLDTVKESLVSSMAEPERSYRDKTVFFLSDGEDLEDSGKFMDTWVPYYKANPDITIYALGVGDVFDTEDNKNLETLIKVTGEEANVVQVDDFSQLHDALAGLVSPEHGNFFKESPSADVTIISDITVWYGDEPRNYEMLDTGDISGLKNTGSIDIGNGIIMVAYENGDYKISSKNISEDYSTTLTLSLVDADGDKYTTGPIVFTVEDHKPWALDRVAVYAPGYDDASLFGSFSSAADSQSEGWHSHHAVWNTWLPEGMEPCPSDPALDAFTGHANMQLTAAPLIVNYAQQHLDGNPLTKILSDLEIPTNLQYVSDLFGYQAALASKSFSSDGGEIVFNWSFEGCGSEGEKDAAFWVLLDGEGTIVDSGRIAVAEDSGDSLYTVSGVTRVPVPGSDSATEYKLVIGCVNGGDANSSDASLVLGSAVLREGHYDFAGNMYIQPWLPPYDNMRLESLVYNGETYTFADGQDILVIEMETGILTANYMGDYTFAAYSDELDGINEQVRYTMVDQDGDRGAAVLTISGDSTRSLQVEHEYPDTTEKADLGADIPGGANLDADEDSASLAAPSEGVKVDSQSGVHIVDYDGNGRELLRGDAGDNLIHGGHGDDTIYGGGGNNTLWGGSGADLFAWADETDLIGKDIIMDFSTEEGDRFSFTELLTTEQSMEDFFRQNISDLSLDAEKNAIAFEIVKDSQHKEVEVCFDPAADTIFSSTKSDYLNAADEAAQKDVLYQFLSNISQ